MPSNSQSTTPRSNQTLALLITLVVVTIVGFTVLYFKMDSNRTPISTGGVSLQSEQDDEIEGAQLDLPSLNLSMKYPSDWGTAKLGVSKKEAEELGTVFFSGGKGDTNISYKSVGFLLEGAALAVEKLPNNAPQSCAALQAIQVGTGAWRPFSAITSCTRAIYNGHVGFTYYAPPTGVEGDGDLGDENVAVFYTGNPKFPFLVITRNQLLNNQKESLASLQGVLRTITVPANVSSVTMADYNGWDLKFKYPSTAFVTQYEDSFVGGRKNIRITSQKGELSLSSGGPLITGPNYFTSGYELDISHLSAGQALPWDGKLVPTNNPLVQGNDFLCEDAGCPMAEYLVTTKEGKYVIDVRRSDDYPISDVREITEAIVSSIHE